MINKNTKIFFSVASNPGNKGSKFYNSYFKKKNINAVYLPLKLTSDFKNTLNIFKELGIAGCSISMPFKKQAWEIVKKKPNYLKNVKSINTIVFNKRKLEGYSTDYYAVKKIIQSNNIQKNKTIIIVGTGSMAQIFYDNLKNIKNKIFFVSRKPKLKNHLKFNNLKRKKFDVLINASPLGMQGFPSFPKKYLDFSICKKIIDVVAYPEQTDLFKIAKKNKINFIGGNILAKYQAKKQLQIYKKVL